MRRDKVVIIGAGIAGLATSIRLAVRGMKVRVLEANAYPGGKLTAFVKNGYRFDAGPSLFTMPQWVLDLFKLAKEDPEDHFKYKRNDLDKILLKCKNQSAIPVTTYKDYVKLPEDLKKSFSVVDIHIIFNKNKFFNFINNKINLYV